MKNVNCTSKMKARGVNVHFTARFLVLHLEFPRSSDWTDVPHHEAPS